MPRPSRRAEIGASAARLIREYGYASMAMDMLADDVGLNKGTLYHYYPSKSAILFELLSDQIDETLELVSRVPTEGDVVERMRTLVRLQVDHVSRKHDELVVFFQELPWLDQHLDAEQTASIRARVDQYERYTRQLLAAGIASGDFRQMDPQMIMFATIGILAYVPSWFRGTTPRARKTLVTELTEFILRGILAPGR